MNPYPAIAALAAVDLVGCALLCTFGRQGTTRQVVTVAVWWAALTAAVIVAVIIDSRQAAGR